MRKISFSIVTFIFFYTVCNAQNFYFKSGFESNVYLNQFELNGALSPNNADIYGQDNITGYDWENDLDNHPSVGNFRIYYEVGNIPAARASIVNDPLNNTNKVLKFQLDSANVPNNGNPKGRVQAAINNNINLKEFSFKVKLYIHPDIDTLKYYNDDFNWFTLMEFWNNGSFQPFPFRITLNIQKPDSTIGSDLYFGTHGQTKNTISSTWDNVWDDLNYNYSVPTGQWLTFETYFFEGDSSHGRYKVTVTDSLNNSHTLFDITDYTHHPQDTLPDGVTNFNPMKLYSSGILIDGMNSVNAQLSVFWDDFEFWIDSTFMSTEQNDFTKNFNNSIQIYPNSTTGNFSIDLGESYQNITVTILDIKGQIIQINTYKDNRLLNLTLTEPAGVYMLVIEAEGHQAIYRLMKE